MYVCHISSKVKTLLDTLVLPHPYRSVWYCTGGPVTIGGDTNADATEYHRSECTALGTGFNHCRLEVFRTSESTDSVQSNFLQDVNNGGIMIAKVDAAKVEGCLPARSITNTVYTVGDAVQSETGTAVVTCTLLSILNVDLL